jgi:hypothetical protein
MVVSAICWDLFFFNPEERGSLYSYLFPTSTKEDAACIKFLQENRILEGDLVSATVQLPVL